MKPKVIIIGKDGYLGSHLFNSPELKSTFEVAGAARASGIHLDLSRSEISEEFCDYFQNSSPKFMVITAAIADVERCAKDPVETSKVNVTGTINILKMAKHYGVTPIFFSSDYVLKPLSKLQLLNETDECLPQTEYGRQKREVENWIAANFAKYLIFRTSKLMSMSPHPKNILSPVKHAFVDQWITPVFIEDIAKIIAHRKLENLSGVYHLATTKAYSRYEIAAMFNPSVMKSSMDDISTLEHRPRFNTLDSRKISRELDFKFTEIT